MASAIVWLHILIIIIRQYFIHQLVVSYVRVILHNNGDTWDFSYTNEGIAVQIPFVGAAITE